MPAELCQIPQVGEATDLTKTLKESAGFGLSVLVEYAEQKPINGVMDSSGLDCDQRCSINGHCLEKEIEPVDTWNGNAQSFENNVEQFNLESNPEQCEALEFIDPLDGCVQPCGCWTYECCTNQGFASECSPSCEHCAEHLQVSQQCEPLEQQFESFDSEPENAAVDSEAFAQLDFISEHKEQLDLPNQQLACFDTSGTTGQDSEDLEQCEVSVLPSNFAGTLFDSDTEVCEYYEEHDETECTKVIDEPTEDDVDFPPNDEECSILSEEEDLISADPPLQDSSNESTDYLNEDDDDGGQLDEEGDPPDVEYDDTPLQDSSNESTDYLNEDDDDGGQLDEEGDPPDVEYDDTPLQDSSNESTDYLNEDDDDGGQLDEEGDPPDVEYDEVCDHSHYSSDESEHIETDCDSGECYQHTEKMFGPNSDINPEEDDLSDCSESRLFETCSDGSPPSEPCFDSSRESDKGPHEDSSGELIQWESFDEGDDEEDDEDEDDINADMEQTKENKVVDADLFDLFDRGDYFGLSFQQRKPYISCFDGGDIHDHLYREEPKPVVQKVKAKKPSRRRRMKERPSISDATSPVGEHNSDVDEAPPGAPPHHSAAAVEQEVGDEDQTVIVDENESRVIGAEEGDDETSRGDAGEQGGGYGYVLGNEEEDEASPISVIENIRAPCMEAISVEGDAYEVHETPTSDSAAEDVLAIDQSQETTVADTTNAHQQHVHLLNRIEDAEQQEDDDVFIVCSESEPYWAFTRYVPTEFDECDVEDYYAYQIKSMQSSINITATRRTHGQRVPETDECRRELNAESEEGTDSILHLGEILPALETGLNGLSLAHESEPGPPLDLIHSVVPEGLRTERRNSKAEEDEESEEDEVGEDEPCECEYCIPPKEQVPTKPLLPQMKSKDSGKICVVIDLDETLVHSSFKPLNNADFIIPVEIDGTVHQVYVLKRPHVDEFLQRMGELFECVLFTASLSKYADPVSDLLDKWGAFRSRLFRESCVFHRGNYVKDLSRLGRDLHKVIIIDNSPASYAFHPDNAVPVASWFDDMCDTELLDLLPFFERLSRVDDVYHVLKQQQTAS
ncbi:hypothetical protein NHX12_007003 [Muraenolepis orangiensis]|uniref:protein-serine/threonine phosphatase n=1 Tax=Muraenolepis orangiensis TaxID=630683 RepID=A0A9Q0DSK5_9TELE|nr:hypothetical protein NHX12_007003 [Muraenolepis orangiensis]